MPEYQDTKLSPGTTYYYRVTALNSAGASAPSANLSVTTPSGLPAAPTGLTAQAVSSSVVNLAWNTSSAATGYTLQRAASSTGVFSTITTTAENTYSNTGLAGGTSYWYRVLATNSAGTSNPSAVVSATTFQVPGPGPGPGGTCPSGSIQVNPGDNIKAIIEGASEGRTICVAPGTYRGTFIAPRNGVSIIARDPAVRTRVKSLAIRNRDGSIYKTIDAYRVRPTVHIHGYPLTTTNPGSLPSGERGQVFNLDGKLGITFEGIEFSRAHGTSKDKASPERMLGRLIHRGDFTARYCWFHRANQAGSSACYPNTKLEFGELGPAAAGSRVTDDSLGSSTYLGCCGGGIKSDNGFTIHDCWVHDNDENGIWSDTPGGSGRLTVYNCYVEQIGYSGLRYENSDTGLRVYDSVFPDSGYLAASAGKQHTGGIAINSSLDAEVHHCRFGGNFQNSGIDISGDGQSNTGTDLFPGPPVQANIHDNDLAGDAITYAQASIHSCSAPGISCANNF